MKAAVLGFTICAMFASALTVDGLQVVANNSANRVSEDASKTEKDVSSSYLRNLLAHLKMEIVSEIKEELRNQTEVIRKILTDEKYQKRPERIEGKKYSLYFTRASFPNYVIEKGAPAMNAITACFWVKQGWLSGDPTYISYAQKGQDNEFLIFGRNSHIVIWLDTAWMSITPVSIMNNNWHSICYSWSSQQGAYKLYQDGQVVARGNGKRGRTLSDGGTWVLGQDQDGVGKGFTVADSFEGELTQVNIWDRVLSPREIRRFSSGCKSSGEMKGNVKSWEDFTTNLKGSVTEIREHPSC